jgi:TonB family protein
VVGQFRAPFSGTDTPGHDDAKSDSVASGGASVARAPSESAVDGGRPKIRHPRLATFYALFLVALAAFGGGRLWDVVRARLDYVDAYFTAIQETRAAFAQALRDNQKTPRANPALPHVISVYPPLAERLGEQGDVTLRVLVLATGQVGDVRIVRSSGFSQLDAAALVGVGSWYYIPAVKDHHPIGTWMVVLVRFRIRGNAI